MPRQTWTGSDEELWADLDYDDKTVAEIAGFTGEACVLLGEGTRPAGGDWQAVAPADTYRTAVTHRGQDLGSRLSLRVDWTAGAAGEWYLWARVSSGGQQAVRRCGRVTVL